MVGDPTEGALLVLGHKAGVDIEGTREALPRLATLPFDPTYKLMATFHQVTVDGRLVVRCFVKGAAPAVMERATTALSAGSAIPWDVDLAARAQANVERMAGARPAGDGGGPAVTSTSSASTPPATCWPTSKDSDDQHWSGWSTRPGPSPRRQWPRRRRPTSGSG